MLRLLLSCLLGVLSAPALAGAPSQDPQLMAGDPAPAFTLQGSDGRTYSLSELIGVRPVVIAWFPRTFTTL